jgi:hypothetical protein
MRTGAAIGLTVGVLAALGLGAFAFDEIEKNKCTAAGGTWEGLLKGGCSTGGSNSLATPSNPTITYGTENSSGTVPATASWGSVTGASTYTLTINGQQVYSGPNTSYQFTATAGQQYNMSVIACP